MSKKNEILSSCCAFGSDGTEDVMVEQHQCPIKSTNGYRERTKYLSVPEGTENPILKECSCIRFSGSFGGLQLPTCPHYQGIKKVKRDNRTKYKVLCGALE
ncbi:MULTISPECIES: hypothetical protein [unclassified Psychrobacillus]|uniref:hypothetical protein n=1 Tax=unclassified Psychrobacillus TaxID=2636677 RepID=UPI0030F92A27